MKIILWDELNYCNNTMFVILETFDKEIKTKSIEDVMSSSL